MDYLQKKLKYMLNTTKKGGLPSAYQEVEWIENDLLSYLKTDLLLDISQHYKIDVKANLSSYKGWNNALCGWHTFYICAPYQELSLRNINTSYDFSPTFRATTTMFDVSVDINNFVISGEASKRTQTSEVNAVHDGKTSANNKPFGVFGIENSFNTAWSGYAAATFKVQNVKVEKNNIEVLNLVPCYRKLDNEIGMYDTVNGVFYTNAGSGEFRMGGLV